MQLDDPNNSNHWRTVLESMNQVYGVRSSPNSLLAAQAEIAARGDRNVTHLIIVADGSVTNVFCLK